MKNERTGCIYKITNLMNGKIYIGLTTQGINKRFTQHMNSPNKKLKIDIDKYGRENFEIEAITISSISETDLPIAEIYYISIYNPEYNIAKGGFGGAAYVGEEHYYSKLIEDEVVEMRELYNSEDYTYSKLSKKYGTNEGNIGKIIRGEQWADTSGPIAQPKTGKGSGNGNSKLTNNIVVEIRELYATKRYTLKNLGEIFGVGKSMIGYIINGDNWKHVGGPIKGVDY